MKIKDFFVPDLAEEKASFFKQASKFNHGLDSKQRAIKGPELLELWSQLTAKKESTPKRALYVHVPFCLSRCAFCSFFSNSTQSSDLDEYTNLVLEEMQLSLAQSPNLARIPLDVVYFGGGTPTDLSAKNLQKILSFISTHFTISPQCEFTVEGRLFGFSEDKILACIENGATRFSFGVQTFDTNFRRRFGRRMTQEEVCEHLELIKSISGDGVSVNLDLIYGLPGQSDALWDNDLSCVQNTQAIDGVDLYRLKLLPGTALSRENKEVSITECQHFFYRAGEFLTNNHWRRLSMTHWGRTKKERNLYNHGAKTGMDILPFGAGAGGMIAGYRLMQYMDLNSYREAVLSHRKALQIATEPDPFFTIVNQVVDQTELGYIDPQKLPKEFSTFISPLWQNWQEKGLLKPVDSDGIWFFTPEGEFWNTALATLVLGAFKQWTK